MLAILTVCTGVRQSRIPHSGCASVHIHLESSTFEHSFEFLSDFR